MCLTISEFWNAPRPLSADGFGYSHQKAGEEIDRLEVFFAILSQNAASYAAWKELGDEGGR